MSISASPQAFRCTKGESVILTFTAETTPVDDITTYALLFYAWSVLDTSSTPAEISKTNGAYVTTPTSTTIKVILTSADTKVQPTGLWGFELWRTDTSSEKRLAFGNFELLKAKKVF